MMYLFIFVTMMIFGATKDFGGAILIAFAMYTSIYINNALVSFIVGILATVILIITAFSTAWSITLVIVLIIWIVVFGISTLSKI